ncbi:MAG: septum site-determining protein MinC [Lachnospiraceae bacterium]|nr:septum site-determining protein MinC [Lachnospiraceae bacterium]
MSQPVVLKSNPHGINLILDPDMPFTELKKEILKRFEESDRFFKNAKIGLSFEGRVLSQEQEYEILDLIEKNTTIHVVCIIENDERIDAYYAEKIRAFEDAQAGRTGEFYKGTLRSGQVIECESSIVILGDVNPGAKIIARGNIVILGSLKGNAYAGAAGDESAFVAALDMDPVQIRIGDAIGRSADKGPLSAIKNRKKVMEPQIAIVSEDGILIEPITKGLFK